MLTVLHSIVARFYLELSPLVDQLLTVVQDPRVDVGRDFHLLETNRMKPGDNHNNEVMIIMIILGKPWDNLRLEIISGVDGENPIASPRVPSLCLVAQVQLPHFICRKIDFNEFYSLRALANNHHCTIAFLSRWL